MTPRKVAIVGGGIAGLSAGFFLKSRGRDKIEIIIYEKENRLGGTIGVTRENGYIADWGPNGFLDREPLTLQFVEQVGLRSQLLPSNDKSERRYIYRNGRLWEISTHPGKFLSSGLLSLRGRLRIGLEYFVPPRKDETDESIFDFAARRIGKEAAEIMIDPMVSGIFGGDARALSLRSCFPAMEEMEKNYGGLIKAMIKKKRERRKLGIESRSGAGGPTGHLTSFRGGLFTLIEALEESLGSAIVKSCAVKAVLPGNSKKYRLITDAEDAEFDVVILAVPSYHAARILEVLSAPLSRELKLIPYASLAVVCHGYRREDIDHPVDGFGFLVPFSQRLEILGSIWTSVIFPEQAPDGQVLFRTMLGGARNGDIVSRSADHLAEIAHASLAAVIGLKKPPVFLKVIPWREAIPQYVIGHKERLATIDKELNALGNLYLAGNAYSGVGLNDVIKRSFNIATAIENGVITV
ncbi:MAG: protoporphyrinogen oxidase [bacterium]|jgi:oxygen-dependent protoporphyrinogen oxidase